MQGHAQKFACVDVIGSIACGKRQREWTTRSLLALVTGYTFSYDSEDSCCTTNYFLSTASESSLPGVNRTRSLAGTWIVCPLRGFTPLRAAL